MENLLDKIKTGDKVISKRNGEGTIISLNENSNYPIKVSYEDVDITYTQYGDQWLNGGGDSISLIEEQIEEVKETQIDINNLSLSELKNLQKDIEKKISEEENKYVDFTNLQYIN